jgi:hypothetical protein
MNWYMLWQLSQIKQAELLKEAQNQQRIAKRGKKSKTPSHRVIPKFNNRGRRLFTRGLEYHRQFTDFRQV